MVMAADADLEALRVRGRKGLGLTSIVQGETEKEVDEVWSLEIDVGISSETDLSLCRWRRRCQVGYYDGGCTSSSM